MSSVSVHRLAIAFRVLINTFISIDDAKGWLGSETTPNQFFALIRQTGIPLQPYRYSIGLAYCSRYFLGSL